MSRFRPSRNYISGEFVITGGPVDITGDLIVSGTITANEYQVNVINTNVTHIDADGNTKFGDTPDDKHQFTGSVFINGPLSASSIIGGGSTTPGAPPTSVQYNDAGSFAGDSDFIWDGGSSTLNVNGHVSSSTISISSSNTAETLFRIDSYDTPYLVTVDSSSSLDGGARLMMRNSNDDIMEPAGNIGRGLFHLEQKSTSSAALEANGLSIWTYAQNNYSSKLTLSTWDPPVGVGSEIQFFTNDGTFPIGGVVDNQALGRMCFGGWDGNDTYLGSLIVARAVENWNFDVKNGTDIEFYTVPIGKGQNSNLKERIRFTSEGHLIVFPYSASSDDALPINTNYDKSAGAPALQVYGPTLFGSSSASTHTFTGSANIDGDLSASINISASAFYGDGSNLTNISSPTGKMLYVDIVNGDNTTATRGDANSPYLTVGSALSDALAQDAVIVRPGTYAESGLTLSSSITLIGEGGWRNTQIGDHSATQNILEVEGLSQVDGITFLVPSSSAGYAGVFYSGSADPTFSIYNCNFFGDASTGQGIGLNKTGIGKIVGAEIRCDQGGLNSLLKVDSGTTALESIHIPPSNGAIDRAAFSTGSGRFQLIDFNIGSSNVTDGIYSAGASTTLVFGINTTNLLNSIHIASDDTLILINGGQMEETGFAVLVDPGLTLDNGTVRITANHNSNYSFPPAALEGNFGLSFFQEGDTTKFPQQRTFGVDAAFGFAERGSNVFAGHGPPYSAGLKIFTTDDTATSVSDGGNFIDVTSAAQSITSGTFTFQDTGSNHTILWTTERVDSSGINLKHWGAEIDQLIAGVDGSYIMEIWDGAAWTEIGAMSTSEDRSYRYANSFFIRADSTEVMRFGIDENTPWATKTINLVTGYWIRARVSTTITTMPSFQRWWVTPSFTLINSEGQRTATGLSQWRKTLVGSGNVFGESGGVVNASIAVGSGGIPTGWNQVLLNAELNGNGDTIYFQFPLPNGICTAYPINIKAVYSLKPIGSSPPDMICSALPIQVAENLVADPSGGKVPVARTIANTETLTAKASQTSSVAVPNNVANKLSTVDFGGFDITSYYEDDMLILRIEMDNGNAGDVVIWSLIIEGVIFADGKTI